MPERLKQILQKVIDWWNKYTTRQKTVIIGLVAAVIFTVAMVVYFTNLPQYTRFTSCESTAEAAEVEELLRGAGIKYKASMDGLRFDVETDQYTKAVWLLGSEGYPADEFTIQQARNGSISTTASDKEVLTTAAYQSKLEKSLRENFANIKSATVFLNIPPQNGTIARENRESSAWIQLEHDGTFTASQAMSIARGTMSMLGNKTTANITITDKAGNTLFAGGDDYGSAGIANSLQELQNQGQAMVANQVKTVLYATGQFNNAEVVCSLDMDYSEYVKSVKDYSVDEGRDTGYWVHRETYESENVNSGSYVPGTDSNDENVMVSPDGNDSSATQNELLEDYILDEALERKTTPAGVINYSNSAMAISLIRIREVHEEDVERQGLLDGISWEEYKLNNGGDIKLEVDPDFYNMAHTATRIPVENISITAFETPNFIDKPAMDIDWPNVLSVIMLVVILALLAFVILRSMAVRRAEPEEEELSVENLLQSTPEPELEDIDVENKSETRKLIEKFVDENPEAAAALLRNWLSADW